MTHRAFPSRLRAPALVTTALMLVGGATACNEDPFAFEWDATPDTVTLYSLARPELNLASGYNFPLSVSVVVEQLNATGTWDVAVDTRGGALVLLPPGALGVDSRARVTTLSGISFEDVLEAPADTAVYEAVDPVPVEMGKVYVIRSGQNVGSFGTRCVYYAKLEPVEIDVAGGRLTFRDVTNPVCNDRKLIPPD